MSEQPLHTGPEYDLFISYSPADREWVEGYLLDALNTAHVRVLSELNFALGAPRISEFERAVKSSKRTLLVLSPAYMAEVALQFVDIMVQHFGLESGTWPVIPLLLKPVELPPRLAFLVALDATDPQNWTNAVTRLCSTLHAALPMPTARPQCPYPGMRAFREQDATHFYGREAEIEELLQRLRRHPFLAVIGPSGSGKSSLVNAGLIPALRSSTLFGPGTWLVRTMRPGAQPMAALAWALDTTDVQQFVPAALLATEQNATHLLLVVDQLEEVFTQGSTQKEVFFDAIQRLSALRDCYVVVTVRADFFSDLLASTLWTSIQAHRLEIAPLDARGLHDAIVKPAEKVGVFIESALVERLVAGSAGQPGLLPFVQEVMVRLWEKLERRYLPLRAYEALVLPLAGYSGSERTGIQAAMAQLADEIIHSLDPEQQRIAQRILLRLVQFGEGRDPTRRQQPVSALVAVGDDPLLFDRTLNFLVVNRLLVLSGEEGKEPSVDLAHEAMLTGWPLLRQWIMEYEVSESTRRLLEIKAAEWARLGKAGGGLLDPVELQEAEAWLKNSDSITTGSSATLSALLEQSRVQRKRQYLARWALIGVAAAGIVALLIWTANTAWREWIRRTTGTPTVLVAAGPARLYNLSTDTWRNVVLAEFRIEQYEVSNREYERCADAGPCSTPDDPEAKKLFDNPARANYPVVGIDANQANTYCRWLRRRLPTQVEWERAGRGTEGRLWPWGDTPPRPGQVQTYLPNYPEVQYDDAVPVDSMPDGATPDGIYHLVGNVAEWVVKVPANCLAVDCQQPWDGAADVFGIAGGAYDWDLDSLSDVTASGAGNSDVQFGFRCVED